MLQSSPCNISTNPGCDVLVHFDNEEEDNAIDYDHTENNTEINPLGTVRI